MTHEDVHKLHWEIKVREEEVPAARVLRARARPSHASSQILELQKALSDANVCVRGIRERIFVLCAAEYMRRCT